MSILVHHLNYSRSLRVLWMLEELELDYEIQHWKRNAGFRAPAAAAQVHPLGRFPMVEVDGTVLAESGAILEYFADREGKLRPSEGEAFQQYRFFMHYAEGSAMPPLLVQLIVDKIKEAPMPFFVKPIRNKIASAMEDGYSLGQIDLQFTFVDKVLSERTHFAGDAFSMADIQMYYAVEAALRHGAGDRRHMDAWRTAVQLRPAFQRAVEKGGPALPSV